MDVDFVPEQIVAWLHKKRGKQTLTAFAAELGVASSTLHRYESGERVPPFHTVVSWAERFPDFPGKITAGKRAPAPPAHWVAEQTTEYGANDPVIQMRKNVERVESADLQLFLIFEAYGLGNNHRSFRDALKQILIRESLSAFALTMLVSWYAADRGIEVEPRLTVKDES